MKTQGLPGSFSNLRELRTLNLIQNKLVAFPAPLFELEKLEVVLLSRNQIGVIPRGVTSMKVDLWLLRCSHLLSLTSPSSCTTRWAGAAGAAIEHQSHC